MFGLFQFVQHHISFLKLHIRIVKRYRYEPHDKCFHREATFRGLGEHEIIQERIILFCFDMFFLLPTGYSYGSGCIAFTLNLNQYFHPDCWTALSRTDSQGIFFTELSQRRQQR